MNTEKYFPIYYNEKSRLSLIFCCCCDKFYMGDEMYIFLDDFMAGMENKVDWLKKNPGGATTEEIHIILAEYKILCHILIYSDKPEHIFAIFLTLEWSLMELLNSCVCYRVNSLDWRDGYIYFSNSKGYQYIFNRSELWHISSNPICPYMLLVLDITIKKILI